MIHDIRPTGDPAVAGPSVLKGLPQILTFGPILKWSNGHSTGFFFFHCDEGQVLESHREGMIKLYPDTHIVINSMFKLSVSIDVAS